MIAGATLAQISQFSEEVERVYRVLATTSPTLRGVAAVAKALEAVDLKETALGLRRLIKEGAGWLKGIETRFASRASTKKTNPKADLVGQVLARLSNSSNPKAQAMAADVAYLWFQRHAVPHGIRGKDFYG